MSLLLWITFSLRRAKDHLLKGETAVVLSARNTSRRHRVRATEQLHAHKEGENRISLF